MKTLPRTHSGTINSIGLVATADRNAPNLIQLYSRPSVLAPADEWAVRGACDQYQTPRDAMRCAAELLGAAVAAHKGVKSPHVAELARAHTAAVEALDHTEHTGTVSIVDGAVQCSRCGGEVIQVGHTETWQRLEVGPDDQVVITRTDEGDPTNVHVRCESCSTVLDPGDVVIERF